jgi:hypothetical protein
VEANSTGGQGSRRAVAPSDDDGDDGGGGDDDDDDMPIQCQYPVTECLHINSASSVYY